MKHFSRVQPGLATKAKAIITLMLLVVGMVFVGLLTVNADGAKETPNLSPHVITATSNTRHAVAARLTSPFSENSMQPMLAVLTSAALLLGLVATVDQRSRRGKSASNYKRGGGGSGGRNIPLLRLSQRGGSYCASA